MSLWCGVAALLTFGVYALLGILLNGRLASYASRARPLGWAAFKRDSYRPDGQRLFTVLMIGWYIGSPLVLLAIGFGTGLVCRLRG